MQDNIHYKHYKNIKLGLGQARGLSKPWIEPNLN